MISDCETCHRKQVPCKSCEESQRSICYVCQGDVADPYCELYLEEAAALRAPRISFIWNYQGHNGGFYDKGPNWLQFTFPPSRKHWRCALTIWYA